MLFMRYVLYFAIGVLGGVLGGMGMGGGTVLIPMLTLIASVPQHVAQAVNLIAFIPMAVVALVLHVKNKLVDFSGLYYLVGTGVMFSAVFSYISANVSGGILCKIFGGFLMVLAIFQFFAVQLKKIFKKRKNTY